MKILKNRVFAVVIAVVVMIVTLVGGVHLGFARHHRNFVRMFNEGFVSDQGFREPSVRAQFERMAEITLNTASMLQGYPELENQVEGTLEFRRRTLEILGLWVNEVTLGYTSMYDLMQSSYRAMANAALEADISERTYSAVRDDLATFESVVILTDRLIRQITDMHRETSPDAIALFIFRLTGGHSAI